MRERMRAVVITAPRTCEVRLVERPMPARDQVLIRVEGCGVCGSSLPRWEGRPWLTYPTEPGTPGHEGWGQIVGLGDDVRGLAIGDRVAYLSERAFAEYDVASQKSIVVLPPSLAGRDVPGEALSCAMNIWRRAQVIAGDTVAIIGIGFLGALLVQIASRAGARVIAISQRAYSRDVAISMGARDVFDLGRSDEDIVAHVEELTHGALCDAAIEVVGLQRPVDLAAKLCRVRGRVVVAGFHQDGPRQVDMFMWNWRGLDVINAHDRDPSVYVGAMAAAVDNLASGKLDPSSLYTHRVPLERAGEAFEALRTRPDGFVKAVVTP